MSLRSPIFRSATHSRPRRRGFTLMEASITTVIVGVGVLSMVELLGTGTVSNGEGAELTTAINLANSVREMTLGLPYSDEHEPEHFGREDGELTLDDFNDLDDFHNFTISPPADARRQLLNPQTYGDWAQHVTVQSVDPNRLTWTSGDSPTVLVDPKDRPTTRITVTILRHNEPIYTQSWLAVYTPPK